MMIRHIGWLLGLGTVVAVAADPRTMIPGFDAGRVGMSGTGEMDLGIADGELSLTRFEAGGFLSNPVTLAEGVYWAPMARYELTNMEFSGWTGPFEDKDLHSLSLSSVLVSMREDSPWLWGGWARAEMATDFEEVDGDDFTFDVAGGIAYRVNEDFTFGLGAALTNLNGDPSFYPGIGFDWVVSEKLRIGAYGPMVAAAYTHDGDWLFTLRFDFAGGVWNVTDNAGDSRALDLTDNRLGLYVSRRLTDKLWLTCGAGVTLGEELTYGTTGGDVWWGVEPDSTWFGVIGLRLKAW